MELEKLLKVEDVAEILNISKRQVFDLKARGKLPFVKIGRSTRFRRNDIETYIANL